jgi:hypothetical protein
MDNWYVSRTIFKPRPRVKNYIYRGKEVDALYVRTLFLTDNIVCGFGEVVLCGKFGLYLKERQTSFSSETVGAMHQILLQKVDKNTTVFQKLIFKEIG